VLGEGSYDVGFLLRVFPFQEVFSCLVVHCSSITIGLGSFEGTDKVLYVLAAVIEKSGGDGTDKGYFQNTDG
jgi:hypothetical protein